MAEENKDLVVASDTVETAVVGSDGMPPTIISSPRVEIDTSAPFASVEEAVTRFGGRGPWIPLHLLRLAAAHHAEVFDMDKMEEQASQLEKDLMVKEQETLNVLKELEDTKRFVEDLKLNLMKDVYSSFLASPNLSSDDLMQISNEKSDGGLSFCPVPSPGLIFTELNQAKSSLNKTTNNLAVIRASVDSLNKKMRNQKTLFEDGRQKQTSKPANWLSVEENHEKKEVKSQMPANNAQTKGGFENSTDILMKIPQMNFEAEQFKNMTEAARYEVVKAMSEIEQTKNTIDMVEMRLVAARKMEEAARAVEAIALAERKSPLGNDTSSRDVQVQNPEKIILSLEEFAELAHKAQKAEDLSKKEVNCSADQADLTNISFVRKFEETTEEIKHSRKSFQRAMLNIDNTNRRKLNPEEGYCRIRSEHNQTQQTEHKTGRFKFRNSHRDSQSNLMKDKAMPVLRSTISIGDVLSRKLILQDNVMLEKHVEEQREVSLSEMLREQSGLITNPPKSMKEENVEKRFYTRRKKFGFIHVSLPRTKSSKKKT